MALRARRRGSLTILRSQRLTKRLGDPVDLSVR